MIHVQIKVLADLSSNLALKKVSEAVERHREYIARWYFRVQSTKS
jgi:hypothetical protein